MFKIFDMFNMFNMFIISRLPNGLLIYNKNQSTYTEQAL